MNILIANWTWYPSGGDWTYIENVSRLYQENGHKVIPFSMADERNIPTEYSEFFIANINYKELNEEKKLTKGIEVLTKSIYSLEAKKNLERLLDTIKIDLAHLNLIHHYITPSILKVLKKRNIPIIWTLHDYTAICPQSTFISNDKICEKCIGGRFYHCTLNKCKKQSYLASSVAALENYVYRFSHYYSYVDYFVCPSVFSYEKYKKHGFFPEKLRQIYHGYQFENVFIDDKFSKQPLPKKEDKNYIVFVGRLEKIKGVSTLLKAMKNNPDIHLKVIGDGESEKDLIAYKTENKLNNVEFMGKRTKEEVWQLIYYSKFLICPSEWYEVLGFTIVEAMLMGKPVIGANIGAIPETVIHNYSGILFEAGNAEELSKRIRMLYNDENEISRLGSNAKAHAEALFSPQKHFDGLKALITNL